MPKLVLEPLAEPKKRKPKKRREAPSDNEFAERQAKIDESHRIAKLSQEEAVAEKKKQALERIDNIVQSENAEKVAEREARAKEQALIRRNRPTFVRTLDAKHYIEVKWRRLTVLGGLAKDSGSGKSKRLGYCFDAVSRGKLTLDVGQTKKFFEKLNGVTPPDDALVHIHVITPEGHMFRGLPRKDLDDLVGQYKEYMDCRKSTVARHKKWMEQFTLCDEGNKGYLNEAETEKMCCQVLKTLHPDEWALRKCYVKLGDDALRGKDVETEEEKELLLAYAPRFLDAYIQIVDPKSVADARFKQQVMGFLCCCARKKKKKAAVYATDT